MQTFLPYADFQKTARCLDRLRLGKQRVEAMQILRTLRGETSGWRNHPAVKMWAGHENCLENYGAAMVDEWVERGYQNNLIFSRHRLEEITVPKWLGDERFHSSHRAALLHKLFDHYCQFGWDEKPALDYVWPVP